MNENVRKAFFRQVGKEPFARKFGIKLVYMDEGYSKVEMMFTPDMENILGMAHGGAIFALMDEAFETASNSHGTIAVALNMNITYVFPPSPGSNSPPRQGNSAAPRGPPAMISKSLMKEII